jgi:hypothetical protein
MWHTSRRTLGIGLALALAATALSGPTVLAFPAPADTTTFAPDSIQPPLPGPPTHSLPHPVAPFESPLEAVLRSVDQNRDSIVRSPETDRYVRVPAF